MPRYSPPSAARSTFAISEEDNDQIERIRTRLGKAGHLLNRSEVIRLGLNALDEAQADVLDGLVTHLDRRRPGRPSAKRR